MAQHRLDADTQWQHIHVERRAMHEILGGLSEAEWNASSVCAGWRIRDVAAHVISAPQLRLREAPAMVWRGRFDFNRMGLLDGQRRGQAAPADILRQYETFDGSRRQMLGTRPLIDILVHTQDVTRALGLTHDMPADAAAEATDQAWRLAGLLGAGHLVRSVRMEATDIDWARGTGPALRAPMQELLLLTAGRARVAHLDDEATAVLGQVA
jgi:uncharacterized protein (TIGR03083 family)